MLFPKSVLPFTIEINSVYIYFSKITNKCTKVWCDVASNSRNGKGLDAPLGLHFLRSLNPIFGYTSISLYCR